MLSGHMLPWTGKFPNIQILVVTQGEKENHIETPSLISVRNVLIYFVLIKCPCHAMRVSATTAWRVLELLVGGTVLKYGESCEMLN